MSGHLMANDDLRCVDADLLQRTSILRTHLLLFLTFLKIRPIYVCCLSMAITHFAHICCLSMAIVYFAHICYLSKAITHFAYICCLPMAVTLRQYMLTTAHLPRWDSSSGPSELSLSWEHREPCDPSWVNDSGGATPDTAAPGVGEVLYPPLEGGVTPFKSRNLARSSSKVLIISSRLVKANLIASISSRH